MNILDLKAHVLAEIRTAFSDVPFPEHLGLRAAMSLDWYGSGEPSPLEIHAPWWEIPFDELRECELGATYLDPAGIEFYLPAYLTMDLILSTRFTFLTALSLLDPEYGDLYERFLRLNARIVGKKKRACRSYLQFARTRAIEGTEYEKTDIDRLTRILDHDFWKQPSGDT